MGSGSATPPKRDPKTPFGLKPSRTNNADTGKVLPWFCGHTRLGVTWLGSAYNQTSEPVTAESSGKGSSDGEVTGYDYSADCAGIVCHGPVDVLREVWMDGDRVWRGTLLRDAVHPNSASIDIEGRGTMYIYWGTENQSAPAVLAANGHPGYRGQCYLFFEQLLFGRDKTNAPDVEVVIERAPLNYTSAVVLPGVKRLNYDASLIHALVELLSHPRVGFGFKATDFDLPQLATVAAKLIGEGIAASPVIDDADSVGSLVERFCEYMDAWPSFRAGAKLQILLARSPDATATAYPLIGEYDLTRTPRHSSESMLDTVNKVICKFTDWTRYFEKDSETWVDAGNYAERGRWNPVTLDRAWVTVRKVAVALARRHSKLASVPFIREELTVRRDLVDDELGRRADEIEVGSFVRFTYANYNQTLLMRVVAKTVPSDRSQAVKLKLESDLYQDAVLGYTPDDPPGPDDDLSIDAGGALHWQVVELPPQLVTDDAGAQNIGVPWFGVFASRRSALDTRLAVYASEDGGTYKRVVVQKSGAWSVYGTLDAALPQSPIVDLAIEIIIRIPDGQADYRPKSAAVGDDVALLRGDYLLYIGGEWLAYREAYAGTDVGGRYVTVKGLVRSRFGAVMGAHAAGSACWLIQREKLKAYTNAGFRLGSDPADNDRWFKVTTGTKTTWFPIGDVTGVSLNITGVSAAPVPAANLRFAPSGVFTGADGSPATSALIWDTTASPLLALLWEDRAWQRHAFFTAWAKPFVGGHAYIVAVRPLGWVEGDDEYQLPKLVYPADVWTGYPGTRVAVVTVADVVTALGALPDVFSVTLTAVGRGLESLPLVGWVVVAGTSGVAPAIEEAQPLQWAPSGLRRLAYATDPERATHGNFETLCAHWGIGFGAAQPVKPLLGLRPKSAKARTAANFAAVQAWVRANLAGQSGFTLLPLATAGQEWVIDANFERLNAIW